MPVALTPSSDFGGNKSRLTEFYKKFGFIENKGKNKRYEISEAMYRDPQQNPLAQGVAKFKATSSEANEAALMDLLSPVGKSKIIGAEKKLKSVDGVERFDSPYGSTRYVILENGKPVSSLQVMRGDNGKARIANVFTEESARRKGLASKLMERAKKDFKAIEHSDDLSPSGAAWANAVEK